MKKTCIIAANCQGAYIQNLLLFHPKFAADFNSHYFVNYAKENIPQELLNSCDLLIYQPLKQNWGEWSEDFLTSNVKPQCRKISISYLTFPIYWPFFSHDKRNIQNEPFPFGQFPYGDSLVINLLEKGINSNVIFNKIKNSTFITKRFNAKKKIDDYMKFQTDLETRRDQKVLDFIMDSYQKVQLFETYNHPALPLCIYQVNDLLRMLGYDSLTGNIPKLDYLKDNQQPIHPYIAEVLNLEFDTGWDKVYNIWKKPLSTTDYYKAYINWDVNVISDNTKNNSEINPQSPKNPIKNEDKLQQILFLHIPKTGGTSLNQMLTEAITGQENFRHYNSTISLIKDKNRRKKPIVMGHLHYDVHKTLNKDCKIITFLRDPITRTISAFEFMKSHPEVWMGKLAQGSIDEFLANEAVAKSVSNTQTRLLGLEINFIKLYSDLKNGRLSKEDYFSKVQNLSSSEVTEDQLKIAQERLKSMFYVGLTENFTENVGNLFSKLNLPKPIIKVSNRTPDKFRKRNEYSQEQIDKIIELNKLDVELYKFAKNNFVV